jgi:hypothetical protein
MKKLFALALALCLGFVFTVGCTPETKKDKKDDKKTTAPADVKKDKEEPKKDAK